VLIQNTKRRKIKAKVTLQSIESDVREQLANKISGTHMGLWLLLPEYQRLGTWDILQHLFANANDTISTKVGMQLINESALGVNRIRAKGSLANQGFAIANGLPFLAADETVHLLLNSHTVEQYSNSQKQIMQMRSLQQHYSEKNLFAIDPHRITTSTKRITPFKKKKPELPGTKVLQTFFCVDAVTGQPLCFINGSSGRNCSSATLQLMNLLQDAGLQKGLFLADKEHFTLEIGEWFAQEDNYDILMPAPYIDKIKTIYPKLEYKRNWAGYATAESEFQFKGSDEKLRLLVQRQGEIEEKYSYKGFLTTSKNDIIELLTTDYPTRWTVEEFFNFEQAHGWNNASTHNLNIKYGKQTLALMAQAATHQLKRKLPDDYTSYTAESLAGNILSNMEGDIRVKEDKIIVTYYGNHEKLKLKNNYENIENQLIKEGINPKIPWLFDFKLEYRFK
jgi:hypothetical protein